MTTTAALLSGVMIASLAGCFPVGPGVGGDGTDGEPLVTPDDSNGDSNSESDDAESSPDWLDVSDPQARAEGCLVGTWTLDNDAWSAEIAATPEFEGGSAAALDDTGNFESRRTWPRSIAVNARYRVIIFVRDAG